MFTIYDLNQDALLKEAERLQELVDAQALKLELQRVKIASLMYDLGELECAARSDKLDLAAYTAGASSSWSELAKYIKLEGRNLHHNATTLHVHIDDLDWVTANQERWINDIETTLNEKYNVKYTLSTFGRGGATIAPLEMYADGYYFGFQDTVIQFYQFDLDGSDSMDVYEAYKEDEVLLDYLTDLNITVRSFVNRLPELYADEMKTVSQEETSNE